ncbi:MAG: NfeD family protein [Sulfolobales archaeon]|nr:ATP-dependent Clp protease proteolytic subunit [Sulfolobales archaeon]MDW8083266.1 NfeD family protein [Sulfolobales archaeon]
MRFYYKVVFILLFLLSTSALASSSLIDTLVLVRVIPPWDMIDSGIAECIVDAVAYAESRNMGVLIELETYGGYLDAALTIGDRIATSRVPVVVYVSGGKAFSAGTLISLPAHIIILSPIATIGAMQPVTINPVTGQYEAVNETKIINPIIEKAIYYARLRNRNTSAVEMFVIKNLVLSADEAVKQGVADYVARDLSEVFKYLGDKSVITSGTSYSLHRYLKVEEYSCGIRSRFLSILSNTLLSSVLTTIGIMATIFSIASGRLEALPIALLFLFLGLVGSGFNPNLISVFLILVGAALLSIELFLTPGFGILGISGIIMLSTGFALLPTGGPTYIAPNSTFIVLSRYVAIGIGVGLGSFTAFVLFKVIQAKRQKTYIFELREKIGRAVDRIPAHGEGFVIVEGEYWKAYSEEEIEPNSLVIVVDKKNGLLIVKKYT